MYYFSYDRGNFFLLREFNDAYDVEIVDVIPFYDVKKISNWCELENIKFPYEINELSINILNMYNSEIYDKGLCFDIFKSYVGEKYINLYCNEVQK